MRILFIAFGLFGFITGAAGAEWLDVSVGGGFALKVSSDGTPPFTYQWYRNSRLISGATEQSYVMRGVAASDSGNYIVIVANTAGRTVSPVAIVSVVPRSIFGKLLSFFDWIRIDRQAVGGGGLLAVALVWLWLARFRKA